MLIIRGKIFIMFSWKGIRFSVTECFEGGTKDTRCLAWGLP